MPIQDIDHKGIKIVTIDFEDCRTKDDMVKMAHKITDYLIKHPDKTLNIFFDYTHGFATRDYMKVAQEGKKQLLESKEVKSAAIGITGIKKVLLQGYNKLGSNKGIVPFNTKEEALDYLATP